jgi:glyoxylase-like metal-dependent hydrolase (beta-lactamase superfamily II)
MTPEVVGFFHKPTFSVSYLVFDPASRRGLVIDPVLDYDHRSGHTSTGFADALLEDVRRRGIAIDWLLETHIHADHLSAQAYQGKAGRPDRHRCRGSDGPGDVQGDLQSGLGVHAGRL